MKRNFFIFVGILTISIFGLLGGENSVSAQLTCESGTIRNGQYCDPDAGRSWCGGSCRVEPVYTPGVNSATGTSFDCTTCAPVCSSGGQVACIGTTSAATTNAAASCRASLAGTICNFEDSANNDDGISTACGACSSCNTSGGYIDCRAQSRGCVTSAEESTIRSSVTCPVGQVVGQCGVCGARSYSPVYLDYFENQIGGIKVTGDIKSDDGNVLLNSGRAIRFDETGIAVLSIANWGSGSLGVGMSLLAPRITGVAADVNKIAELRFTREMEAPALPQDMWTMSLRAPSNNFEIWRNNGGWSNALTIDYATGNVVVGGTHMYVPRAASEPAVRVLGNEPGAFYYSTAPGNTGLKVYNGPTLGWTAVGGGGGSTYTQGEYVTIDGTRISATHSGGCFGPVYVGPSNLARNGDREGYLNANAVCRASTPVDIFANSHVCSTQEISNSINCEAFTGKDTNGGASMWINNLGPSLPTPTNDCGGWRNDRSSGVGVAYAFNIFGGSAGTASCDQSLHFACCK